MSLNLISLSKIVCQATRLIHTAPIRHAKPARAMRKIMGGSSKGKRRIYCDDSPVIPTPEILSRGTVEGKYSGNSRRAAVLNKMFMKYITDLMATGENATEFLGHGIEINRIQITPDFKGLNVFWVARGSKNDQTVEEVLQKNAGYLRHELSTLRVMGAVPKIYFVKDKKSAQILEIDARLAEADFGEDHIPVEMATKLKTQLELYTPLDPDVKEKIQALDQEFPEDNEIFEEPLPPMPQDVLGLNHAEILERIRKSMKKSEAVHRLSSTTLSDKSSENLALDDLKNINENPLEFGTTNRQRREAFKEFLEKRELLRSRSRKLNKNYIPDVELIKEEYEERQRQLFENMGQSIYEKAMDKELSDYLLEEDKYFSKE